MDQDIKTKTLETAELYFFRGVPAANSALKVLRKVLQEKDLWPPAGSRPAAGPQQNAGKAPAP
jgi:hypothetical protein